MNRAVLVFEYRPKPCSEPQAAKALITRHAPDISCGQKRSAAQNKKRNAQEQLGNPGNQRRAKIENANCR
jgi:hypothetical protein